MDFIKEAKIQIIYRINAKIEDFYFCREQELGYKFYNSDVLDLTVYSNLYDGHSIKGSNMNYGYKTINKRRSKLQLVQNWKLLCMFLKQLNFTTSLEGGKEEYTVLLNFQKL